MSNVYQLFPSKPAIPERPPIDVTGLISVITDWAIEQGVDVYNDAAFQIRVTDLMSHLQVMAHDSRRMIA